MKRISVKTALRIALLAGSLLAVVGTSLASDSHSGGIYRAPLSAEPVTLDPARYSDIYSMSVAANLFDGLVQFDEQLKVVPAIASIWKISRDQKTYTFILRDDVKFHHGRTVTAEDFVFSMSRILHPDTNSPVASLFMKIRGAKAYNEGNSEPVAGLQAVAPNLLRIELDEPFAPFLSILAMVNAKVIPADRFGPDFDKNPVGTGPFRFETWEPGKNITLSSNADYFEGAPQLAGLQFRIYPDGGWERIFQEFQEGALEHATIPADRYEQMISNPAGYTLVTKPGLNLVYIGLNANVPPLDDVRVRQAINYAVDTDHIVQTITKRGAIPGHGILPPGISGFDPDFPGYNYDPERAKQLLIEAGFGSEREFPVLKIWAVNRATSVRRELEAYQEYLAAIGIPLEIHMAENWKSFLAKINGREASMFYAAWYADYPDPDNFLFPLTHSASRTNRMGINIPEVDSLIDRARITTDYLERAQLYRTIERTVMQSAPIISQHINSSSYMFQRWVQGAHTSRLGAIYLPYKKIWFDPQQHNGNGLAVNTQ